MTQQDPKYIPALSFKVLTPLYDTFFKLTMQEEGFKRRLIEQAQIRPSHRVLDLGCGTGTLTVMIKEAHPDSEVTGLDGDPQILEIARQKAAQAGTSINFDEGMAYRLPYPDASFDRVLSSIRHVQVQAETSLAKLR